MANPTPPPAPAPVHEDTANGSAGNFVKFQSADPFTRVPNAAVNDPALDLKALGLLVVMLSKPPGWRFSEQRLAADAGVGRRQVRTAIESLVDAGYVRRVRVGSPPVVRTEVYDVPQGHRSELWPRVPECDGGEPVPLSKKDPSERKREDPSMRAHARASAPPPPSEVNGTRNGQPATNATGRGKQDKPRHRFPTAKEVPKHGYPAEFEKAWSAYPRKTEKRGAYVAWRARVMDHGDDVIPRLERAASAYAAAMKAEGRPVDKMKHGATFYGPREPWEEYAGGTGADAHCDACRDNADAASRVAYRWSPRGNPYQTEDPNAPHYVEPHYAEMF